MLNWFMEATRQKGGSMSEDQKQTKAEAEEAKRAEAIERERQAVAAHAIAAVQHNFGRTSGRVSIYKR